MGGGYFLKRNRIKDNSFYRYHNLRVTNRYLKAKTVP